jgi:hypothetical protein
MLGRANAGRDWLCGEYMQPSSRSGSPSMALSPWGGVTRGEWERESVIAVASDSAGDVTTFRPEHVVNRADRTPVAVGPR